MAGIFAGSLFLVGVNWVSTVLWSTIRGDSSHIILNLVFGVLFGLTTFFYSASMRYDPGFVPKLNGIAEQRAVIDELLASWKYDETNFCVTCMIRTPLRSKHCRRCQRCVAKHDQYVQLTLFVLTDFETDKIIATALGSTTVLASTTIDTFSCILRILLLVFLPMTGWCIIVSFPQIYLGCACVNLTIVDFGAVSKNAPDTCNVFGASLCRLINSDAYTLFLAVWVSLQLIWVTMLVFTQLVQVSRAMTTFENMTGIHTREAATALTSTGTPLDPSLAAAAASTSPHGGHGHGHKTGMLKQWSRILGVDPFIETITGRGAATGNNRRKKKNPYSRGCVSNCKDFWCDPAPVFGQRENGTAVLGGGKVDYTAMYESPTLMRLTGMRTRGGYESVETEEV